MNNLPPEIISTIIAQLDVHTLIQLVGTCRRMHFIITEDIQLWRKHYEQKCSDSSLEDSWLVTFRTKTPLAVHRAHSKSVQSNGFRLIPMYGDWYRTYLWRCHTEQNWRRGQYIKCEGSLPAVTMASRYRLLGKSPWGAVILSEGQRKLYAFGVSNATSPWVHLPINALPDCTYYPSAAKMSQEFIVVCGEAATPRVDTAPAATQPSTATSSLASTASETDSARTSETLGDDTSPPDYAAEQGLPAPMTRQNSQLDRDWMHCLWAWQSATGELRLAIHSPERLRPRHVVDHWLLLEIGRGRGQRMGSTHQYRVFNLKKRCWCTGVIMAATGICHIQSSSADQVEVFIGIEATESKLISVFHWQLVVFGRGSPRVIKSGRCPHWPMLARVSSTSARLDRDRVLLQARFMRPAPLTYLGVLSLKEERLLWREPMCYMQLTAFPELERLVTLGSNGTQRAIWSLEKGEFLDAYPLPRQYHVQRAIGTLGFAYHAGIGHSYMIHMLTGEKLNDLEVKDMNHGMIIAVTPSQLLTVESQTGRFTIYNFATI